MTSTLFPQFAGKELKEFQTFEFADENEAAGALPSLQNNPGNNPIHLPNGDQVRKFTNGEMFFFQQLGKYILLFIFMTTGV